MNGQRMSMQKRQMYSDTDFSTDRPENVTDTEGREFFSHSEEDEKDAVRMAVLARMAQHRRAVSVPDVDAEWHAFKHRHAIGKETVAEPRRGMSPWVAALLGAAAMLVCVWCYDYAFRIRPAAMAEAPVVVLEHDSTPGEVMLSAGSRSFNVSSIDTLSYVKRKGTAVARVAGVMEQDTVLLAHEPVVHRVSAPRGRDCKIILADGSTVTLNAESTIEFSPSFTDTERRVSLKGEAFFKVERDDNRPFIVSTDRMDVCVLGTEFNFRNYENAGPHVSLVKGEVQVFTKDDGEAGVATLKPGEGAWCDDHGKLHVGEDDIYAVTQWVNGFFYFDNRPLADVLMELGRWYNLGVVFKQREAMDYKLHFSASRDGKVDEVVYNLNRLRKVQVAIEGHNLVVY